MNKEDAQKRNELIGQFVVATAPDSVAVTRFADIDGVLCSLIHDFGYDPQTQAFVMRSLIDLFEIQPVKARHLTLRVALDVRHNEERADHDRPDAFESKLVQMWKTMLINDPVLSDMQKEAEATRIAQGVSSDALVLAARQVAWGLKQNTPYAVALV